MWQQTSKVGTYKNTITTIMTIMTIATIITIKGRCADCGYAAVYGHYGRIMVRQKHRKHYKPQDVTGSFMVIMVIMVIFAVCQFRVCKTRIRVWTPDAHLSPTNTKEVGHPFYHNDLQHFTVMSAQNNMGLILQ